MRYLIPLAANDDLFPREEFHFPKPLIEINNVPMIALAIRFIKQNDADAEFIFVVNRADCAEFSLDSTLELSAGSGTVVVQLTSPTKGALCSCLMAVNYINDDKPLTIVNGDQIIEANLLDIQKRFQTHDASAGVVAFESVHPRWSYIRTDDQGHVTEAAEKRVISRKAIAGLYYFKKGAEFVMAGQKTILDGSSVNGKYYISSTLNQIILTGGKVTYQEIDADAYHSFYSPQKIDYFMSIKNFSRIGK